MVNYGIIVAGQSNGKGTCGPVYSQQTGVTLLPLQNAPYVSADAAAGIYDHAPDESEDEAADSLVSMWSHGQPSTHYTPTLAGTFMLAQNPIQVPSSLVEDNTSFCFHFCKNLVNLPQFNRSTDRVYVINYSVGQTFVHPDPPGGVDPIFNSWSPQIAGGVYASLIQGLQATKDSLATQGGLQLAALLWHQGEADSAFQHIGKTYLSNLKDVLDQIRINLNAPTLPIVGGTLGPLATLFGDANVTNAISNFASIPTDGNAALANFADLNVKPGTILSDNVHFSRNAHRLIGQRY
jgi:hypothetical protein